MKKCVIFFLFFLSFGGFIKSQTKDNFYIILLAGQSNMAGRGISRPAIDTVTYSNIFSLNKDSVWVRAKNPLHWDKTEAGVGMGITFAHELALKLGNNVKIGLVPCAAGGTYLDQWLNNSFFGNTGQFYLYANLISRAKKAAKSGKIIGMIWHQGESDATTARYATYKTKLNSLFQKIRNDLALPSLPIIAGELGYYLVNNNSYPRWDSINSSIQQLKRTLPYYEVVSAAGGLTCNTDITHFTSESQVILGKRYAEAFYKLAFPTTSISNVNYKSTIYTRNNKIHISQTQENSTTLRIYSLLGKLIYTCELKKTENEVELKGTKGTFIAQLSNPVQNIVQQIIIL